MSTSDKNAPKTHGTSALRKAGLLLGRIVLTAAVVTGAGIAVYLGSTELSNRAEAAPTPEAAPTLPVSATPFAVEPGYEITRVFVGQVEPQRTVSVSFELDGQLDQIMVDEGDTVTKGQELATQDTALLKAEQAQLVASKTATQAQLRLALQTLDRVEKLTEQGHTSQSGLDEALSHVDELRARIAETEAALRGVAIRIGKSKLVAPFDSRVTERLVDGGESLGGGQPILELVQLNAPQLRVGVPLDLDQADLQDGDIQIGTERFEANLVTLRPDIDPVTRTRTAIFEIETQAQPAFGQTARLMLTEHISTPGIWVPTTSLKEGTRGQWTVLSVDAQQTVRALAVHVLHAESDRAFVSGAFPDDAYLIDQGPQRVTVGQRVTIAAAE